MQPHALSRSDFVLLYHQLSVSCLGVMNMIKNPIQIQCTSIVLFCAIFSGCSEQKTEPVPEATVAPHQVVHECFDQMRKTEGKYFDHVWQILETEGGVPALVEELDSIVHDNAFQAWIILSRISSRLDGHDKDTEPKDKAYWENWWTTTGQSMPIDTMKSNFASHWM